MAERLKVNPTRMELRRLKDRLKTAVRGHKLLKDKSDEMIRRFMEYAKQNKALREEVEKELADALRSFVLAKAVSDEYAIRYTRGCRHAVFADHAYRKHGQRNERYRAQV